MVVDGDRVLDRRFQQFVLGIADHKRPLVKNDLSVYLGPTSGYNTDLGARSSPAAAKRCAKGAELEGAPKSVTSSKRSQIFSSFV
jgi:hypothetical protein